MINQTFVDLAHQMVEIHHRKNQDYARDDNPYSNFEFAGRIADEFTDPTDRAFAVLIGVKLARLGQLLGQGKSPQNESIDDTLTDMATYVAIWTSNRRDRSKVAAA